MISSDSEESDWKSKEVTRFKILFYFVVFPFDGELF